MKKSKDKSILEKIEFVKFYWKYILNNGIDIYSQRSVVNLTIIIEELIDVLNIKNSNSTVEGNVRFKFKELKYYINHNYFYKCNYKDEIDRLKELQHKYENEKDNIIDIELEYIKPLNNIYQILNNNNNLFKLKSEIENIVYNDETLKNCVWKIQSLSIDYICELLKNGFDINYLKNHIFKINIWEKEYKEKYSQKEEINLFLERPFKKDVKITYVFKVLGLKINIPFMVGEILFYNPFEEGLLKYKFKESLLENEEDLLYPEELELLNEIKKNNSTMEHSSEIEYTDCHARVTILAKEINQGLQNAINKVNNIVNIIKFKYKLKDINISKQFYAINRETCEQQSPFYVPNLYRERKYNINYYPQDINKKIIEDLKSGSNLDRLINGNSEDIKKALYWYSKGKDSGDHKERFTNYWISLEFIINIKKDETIKKQLINITSKLLVLNSFNGELIFLYNYFRNLFFSKEKIKALPMDIAKIKGLGDFKESVCLKIFADNLQKFITHSDNEFIRYRLEEFYKIYTNISEQRQSIRRLEKSYQNLISRLYKIRNDIVHNAMISKVDIEIYSSWLEFIVDLLINSIFNIDINEEMKWNYDLIEQQYNEWNTKINNKEKIEIIY